MEGRWAKLALSAHAAGRLDIGDLCKRNRLTTIKERALLKEEARLRLEDVIKVRLTTAHRMEAEDLHTLTSTYASSSMPWVFDKQEGEVETKVHIEDILDNPEALQEVYEATMQAFNSNKDQED